MQKLIAGSTLAELAFNAINAEATLGVAGVGHHPASSLSRVAICKGAIEYARTNKVDALLHGSNGSQNNPYRFMSALNYFKKLYGVDVEELSPNIGGTTVERNSEALYLRSMGVGLKSQAFEKDVSHDRNLCGDEWEEDFLANPKNAFDVREAALRNIPIPPSPLRMSVKFKEGLPVALKIGDGEFIEKKPLEMLEELNAIGLQYRIGIYDYAESRPVGINAREVHIAPAMDILIKTHNWLRAYQLDRPTNMIYDQLSKHQSDIIQQNFHQSPEREQIDVALKEASKEINGEVGFTLEQGLITNISSCDADKFMEGKVESATKEFVKAHVEGGVDEFTKESVALLIEQLALIEQKKCSNDKLGNSPSIKEVTKVAATHFAERSK
jgi:argininosuccinate synthase